jgi:hypothetical protein
MRKTALTALCLVLLLPALGCNRKQRVIEIDQRFSMNIVRVPSWFPPDEEPSGLTATEEAVIREKGRPDFIRFWWRHDGSFITSSDLLGKVDVLPDMMESMKRTWIYRRQDLEIEFLPQGGYLEHPMTEKLKLICDYGDPSVKGPLRPTRTGQYRETWTWYDHGLIIEFLDDIEVKRNHFTGTGEGTFLGR